MRRVGRGIGFVFAVLAASSAWGFTQKSPITPIGHEKLIVLAAGSAGGSFAEPSVNQIDSPTAGCRWCDRYDTANWKTWSAVMGNRWADIGGYDVPREMALANLRHWSTDCFDAVVQDSNAVQFQHSLRQRCDFGMAGFTKTLAGTSALIHDRFVLAVRSAEGAMWFRDGGTLMVPYKADRPYFLLGLAIHALQDTFSEEHTERTADWSRIRNFKTWVASQAPTPIRHAREGLSADSFKFDSFPKQTPNALHGDNILTPYPNFALKPSATQAIAATGDLIHAFEAARRSPGTTETVWAQFQAKWLQGAPDPSLGTETLDASCTSDPKGTEQVRLQCLQLSGTQPDFGGIYPPFCWPDGACNESFGGRAASEAATLAVAALATVQAQLGVDFGRVAQDVEDFFSHAAHSFARCYEESGDFGVRASDNYMSVANDEADRFFVEIGDAYGTLTLAERKTAIDARWSDLESKILSQASTVRDASCSRVRGWFDLDSSKADGEVHCRDDFNDQVASLPGDLQGIYEMNMHKGLPDSQTGATGGASAPLGHNHQNNLATLEARARADYAVCQSHVTKYAAALAARAGTGKPAVADTSAARTARCDAALNAKLSMMGKGTAPPAQESEQAKRQRFYAELQACVRNPVARFYNPLGQRAQCTQHYAAELASAGLALRPRDETSGSAPNRK
jgi:hypothetical protein